MAAISTAAGASVLTHAAAAPASTSSAAGVPASQPPAQSTASLASKLLRYEIADYDPVLGTKQDTLEVSMP